MAQRVPEIGQAIFPPAHSARRRLLLDGNVTTIQLDGMGYREAKQMVSSLRPRIDSRLARRLWLHTSGHPLYLRSLLSEHHLLDGPCRFNDLHRQMPGITPGC